MKLNIETLKQSQKPNFFSSSGNSPTSYFFKHNHKTTSFQQRNQSVQNEQNVVSNSVTLRKTNGTGGMHFMNRKKDKQFSELLESLSLFKSSDDISGIKFKILENIKLEDKSHQNLELQQFLLQFSINSPSSKNNGNRHVLKQDINQNQLIKFSKNKTRSSVLDQWSQRAPQQIQSYPINKEQDTANKQIMSISKMNITDKYQRPTHFSLYSSQINSPLSDFRYSQRHYSQAMNNENCSEVVNQTPQIILPTIYSTPQTSQINTKKIPSAMHGYNQHKDSKSKLNNHPLNNIINASIQVLNPFTSANTTTKYLSFNQRRLSGGTKYSSIGIYKLNHDQQNQSHQNNNQEQPSNHFQQPSQFNQPLKPENNRTNEFVINTNVGRGIRPDSKVVLSQYKKKPNYLSNISSKRLINLKEKQREEPVRKSCGTSTNDIIEQIQKVRITPTSKLSIKVQEYNLKQSKVLNDSLTISPWKKPQQLETPIVHQRNSSQLSGSNDKFTFKFNHNNPQQNSESSVSPVHIQRKYSREYTDLVNGHLNLDLGGIPGVTISSQSDLDSVDDEDQ